MSAQRQLFEYHPTIGYRFIPGIRARVPHEGGGYLVRTNDLGFRCDHEVRREKAPRTRRVLLFGDSYSAGDGVSNGKRYGDLLERLIPDLEVYNFALPGTGTDQQYLAYREFARDVKHDLLVVAVLVENIRRVLARYRPYESGDGERLVQAKPYYELVDGALTLRHVPVPRQAWRGEELPAEERAAVDQGGRFAGARAVIGCLGLKGVVQRITRYQPVPEYDDPRHPGWLLMRALLERWIREHDRPVVVVPIPLYQFVEETSDPSGYQARFRELAAATGCALHDPLPHLRGASREERRRFRFERDVHPTPEGHAALAASLTPMVARVLESGAAVSSAGPAAP